MTWWQTWKHALAHPADNVVAAVVVLLGVVVTAATTLIVSAANRRHERGREARERLFEPRAETYLAVRDWLRRDIEAAQFNAQHRDPAAVAEIRTLSNRLSIWGSKKIGLAFAAAVSESASYHKRRLANTSGVIMKAEVNTLLATLDAYDAQARQDLLLR